jgi:tetratricopeptide (TPR) repeat protein
MSGRRGSRVLLAVTVFVAIAASGAVARAGAAEEAAELQKAATTSFAVGNYEAAGESFEKAYVLDPQPALLYNAAQAYRLAGNRSRALTLYQNYRRIYGDQDKPELADRIEELRQAIAQEQAAAAKAKATATATVPVAPAPAPPPPEPNPEPPVAPPAQRRAVPVAPSLPPAPEPAAPVLVDQPPAAPAPEEQASVLSKPWFWIVAGGVAAAAIVAVVIATGGAKDPTPTAGRVYGN